MNGEAGVSGSYRNEIAYLLSNRLAGLYFIFPNIKIRLLLLTHVIDKYRSGFGSMN